MTTTPVRAELFLGGVWQDVSKRLRRSPVTVRRGRSDEGAQATASGLEMVLKNTDGALTPRNPESIWYPGWKRGTRCRVWADGGTPALVLPGVTGANATTPDTAVLDITGTITVLARIDPATWAGEVTFTGGVVSSGDTQRLLAKWSTGNRSWDLHLSGPGWLAWEWSADGTTSTRIVSTKVVASLKPMWVGVTFVPNNGAGGKTVTWWTSRDGVTFTELQTQTVAGTSSIFSGSAPVEIGTRDGLLAQFEGRVLGARIFDGTLAGTLRANPDFTAQTPGTRTFVDSVGRTWTVNSTAEIATRTIRGIGQVDEIQTDWPHATLRDDPRHEGVSTVAVTASGMLRRMGQGAKPLQSTLYRKVTSPSVAGNVRGYWPMEDGSEATQAASPIPGAKAMNIGGGTLRMGSDSTLHASKPLPHSDQLVAWATRVPSWASPTQARVDLFVRIDTPNVAPDGTPIMAINTHIEVERFTIAVDDTNVAVVGTSSTGGGLFSTTFPSDPLMFGTWTLWSFNWQQNGGNVDWDLTIVPIPLGVGFGTSGSYAGPMGRPEVIHNWLTNAPDTGGISFGHLIVSTGLGLGWLAGADTAWVGETAAHRFWRLCVEENIPVHILGDPTVSESFRGTETLSAPMGPQGQSTLVDLLAECAHVDRGVMSEHRTAAALDFRTRASLYNQTAALTLDTNDRGVSRGFGAVDDDQRLRNDVTATRPDGSSARVTTVPPPEPGDLYDDDIPVNVASDLQLPDQAAWRLHLGTWPAMRYPGLSTSLRTAGPAVAAAWADIALGDRITLDNMPRQHEKTTHQLLEGYTETLSHLDWTAELNCSPAGPWDVGVRDDDELGIRDTGGSVLDAAFNAGTATTMDVETTLGPLWAVTAASNSALPFDLNVGGYQITCTAIGAAVGQVQTFTVSTTIANGLRNKTIPAGTAVSVWRPARRAL